MRFTKLIQRKNLTVLFGIIMVMSTTHTTRAAVDPEQAKRLDAELTPLGAQRSGNEDGSIPEWKNETPVPPDGYRPGKHHPDPFPDDQPLYKISANNLDNHAELLSEGHKLLLRNNPSFYMSVYPTRRTATYPDSVYQQARQNAVSAKLVDSGEGVADSIGSVPFPIPQNAYEVMWNHKLRYRGEAVKTYAGSAVVNNRGDYSLMKVEAILKFMFADTHHRYGNQAIQLVGKTTSPPRSAGNKLLVHESINSYVEPRKSWVYLEGQRRTRRAPDISYDAPYPGTDGIVLVDNTDMFNGAFDRFDWNLQGKKELIIPYNSYRLHDAHLSYDELLQPRVLNPKFIRYERHRVWVVQAILKPGARHRYGKRVFYIDEDSWQVALVDQYDGKGNLISFAEGHPINYYENPLFWYTLEVIYNLQDGRYYVSGLDNQEKMYDFTVKPNDRLFKPSSLARMR